ncbi:MAG TPA: hypothetical protein VNX88_12925 [Terriglobales bacterium]|jgi:hypothetical protein|nr:hypothetical protein [Terriglobales bacterium]
MSRNPSAPKPVAQCEGFQYQGETEGEYFDAQFSPDGWTAKGSGLSQTPGGDPGRFRNSLSATDFKEGDWTGFNVIGEQDDRGQSPRSETVFVDNGRADRGRES